jgi:hypothetical protein
MECGSRREPGKILAVIYTGLSITINLVHILRPQGSVENVWRIFLKKNELLINTTNILVLKILSLYIHSLFYTLTYSYRVCLAHELIS